MASLRLLLLKKVLMKLKKRSKHEDILGARFRLEKRVGKFNIPLPGFRHESFKIGELNAEWITPKGADTRKVLLFLHGGGYAAGSIRTHRSLVAQIAKHAGIRALMIDYRLAPEHPYPAAIEDTVATYQWLLQSGYLPSNIAFGGDSAGGGLCIGSLLYLRDHHLPLPKCAIAMSPWLDHTLSGESYHSKKYEDPMLVHEGFPFWSKNYLGDADPKSPYASPIFHELKGLPPIYIQVGDAEMLLDDSIRFADKAKAEEVDMRLEIYPDKFHVFHAFWLVLPKARQANRKLGEFLKAQLN